VLEGWGEMPRLWLILGLSFASGLGSVPLGRAQVQPTPRIAVAPRGTPGPAPNPPAQVAVSPPRFELAIGDRPAVGAIRILNLSNRAITVRVKLANWILDEANQIQEVEPTAQSLVQWIVVNPLRFEIAAHDSQVVRFSIRPRVKPEPGEHRGVIFLEEVPPEEPGTSGLRLVFRYGVVVYGYVGEVKREGKLHSVNVDSRGGAVTANFDIESTGSAHVRMSGQYAIWPAASFPGAEKTSVIADIEQAAATPPAPLLEVGSLPTTPVLPSFRRTVRFTPVKQLPPGDYVLDIKGNLPGQPIDQAVAFHLAPQPSPTPETPKS
jgi:P pilus assembly chaperone PapD